MAPLGSDIWASGPALIIVIGALFVRFLGHLLFKLVELCKFRDRFAALYVHFTVGQTVIMVGPAPAIITFWGAPAALWQSGIYFEDFETFVNF